MLDRWKRFRISAALLSKHNIIIIISLFRQGFNVSVCSALQKIFVIACVLDIMRFENILQFFLIAVIAVHVINNKNYQTFHPSGIYLRQVNNRNTRTRFEIYSKLTIKTPERHQLTSFQCLYCKLYTHFTACLVFALLTLNMQLFAGQLSSFL